MTPLSRYTLPQNKLLTCWSSKILWPPYFSFQKFMTPLVYLVPPFSKEYDSPLALALQGIVVRSIYSFQFVLNGFLYYSLVKDVSLLAGPTILWACQALDNMHLIMQKLQHAMCHLNCTSIIPRSNLVSHKRSFVPSAARIWNSLPEYIPS